MRKALLWLARERTCGLLALLVLTTLVVSVRNPGFLQPGNLLDILVQAAPVMIVACGVMMVIVCAEIDISVGSLMGLLAATLAVLASTDRLGLPPAAAVPAVLLAGTLVGLGTGALVTWAQVPSIIVTLGLLTALRGITVMVMQGEDIKAFPDGIRVFGLSAGWTLGLTGLVIALTAVLLKLTPVGRRMYALGSSPHSAEMAGLSATRIKLFAFAYTGLLTAVATLIRVAKLGNVSKGLGTGLELLVVTCVVVGGVSISGGRGRLRGVLLAVVLLVMVRTVLTFMGLGPEATKWERAIQGAFILLAVVVDHLARPRMAAGAVT